MVQLVTQEISDRSMQLLRCLSFGPLFKKQIERALPALLPELLQRNTAYRLLYRELNILVKKKLVGRRRPLACRSLAYFLTERGADIVEGNTGIRPDLSKRDLFFTNTAHEELIRSVLLEFVLFKHQEDSPLIELGWQVSKRYDLETEDGAPKAYVPDLVLLLTLRSGAEFTVIVEVDRQTETHTTVRAKFDKARYVLDALGAKCRLLVVTLGERRQTALMELFRAVVGGQAQVSRWITAERFDDKSLGAKAFRDSENNETPLVDWNENGMSTTNKTHSQSGG